VPPTSTPTVVVLPTLGRATGAVRGWMEGSLISLDVPIRSQFDGSEYQAANCGPTALAMVLEGFGVAVPTPQLRNLANRLQGTYDRDAGIALQYLGDIAALAGLRPIGLRDGGQFHRWTVDEVRDEVRHGHPVITLVRMRELPDYAGSRSDTDHYVVVVGLDGQALLVNDPARPGDAGFHRPLTPDQLERAWAASSIPRQALALAAPAGVAEVSFPVPGAGAGPGAAVQTPGDGPTAQEPPSPSMTLPRESAAPAQVGQPQIVVVVTPVIYVNVNLPPNAFPQQPASASPSPVPTRDRWARPDAPAQSAAAGVESPPPMPIAQPLAGEPTPARWTRPPAAPGGPPTIVLGASGRGPSEGELRWVARVALLGLGALALRWALR